jgi:nucleoside 2-deoxyribosyltransferase
MQCERADDRALTKPILDKINDFIRDADVIIADCSGRNPNVFYELGIAHALGKKVILITKDPIKDAPSDIRHFEFIHYELDKHVEFLEKLESALRNVFAEEYESLYKQAKSIFNEFKQATNLQVEIASKEVFLQRIMAAEGTQGLPAMDDVVGLTKFVLPLTIAGNIDVALMEQILKWTTEKRKTL